MSFSLMPEFFVFLRGRGGAFLVSRAASVSDPENWQPPVTFLIVPAGAAFFFPLFTQEFLAMATTITRSKGGTKERQVPINLITIPDLWHIANRLPVTDCDLVLEVWHLAHDLLQHVRQEEAD